MLHRSSSNGQPEGPSILVVDDEPASARLMVRVLERAGFRAVGAEGASTALRLAEEESFDLLLSDISMPGKNGWDLMREMAERRPMPGIAFSAYDSADDRARSRAAGFAAHLAKPVDIDVLLDTVRCVLDGNCPEP